jgi:hypothetical protein
MDRNLAALPVEAKKPVQIDVGPFLRQEGRHPSWRPPSQFMREEVIRRLRQDLGMPPEPFQNGIRQKERRSRPMTAWMAELVQRIRQPG